MSIDFACPQCGRQYHVKDELAGKNAKCGQCGHKMPIPQSALATSTATKPTPRAPAVPPQAATTGATDNLDSWMADELGAPQPKVTKPQNESGRTCPACDKPLGDKALICIACGHDTRTRTKLETHVPDVGDKASKKKRSKLGSTASLIRGTVFSLIGALLGAIVWAGLAYVTQREFGIIAWGLGGLAGFGMALGHEDSDGTLAGIIAAFISLVGILAAKILIIVVVVAALVVNVAQKVNPVEMKRTALAGTIAQKNLQAQGIKPENVGEQQWEQANTAAEAELAKLSDQEVEARWDAFLAAEAAAEKAEAPVPGVAPPQEQDDAEEESEDDIILDNQPGLIAEFFKLMFSPIDGIFMLFAFFTAYKVGSGQKAD